MVEGVPAQNLSGKTFQVEEDTEGQGYRLPPKREPDRDEEDVEGHRLGMGSPRPPVD
jgi:hypothetical protein